MSTIEYAKGERVEISPSCDLWMQGARYGEVTRVTTENVYVKLDRTGKRHVFTPEQIFRKV